MRKLGIDIGSLSLGAVMLEGNAVATSRYAPHHGDLRGALAALLDDPGLSGWQLCGITTSHSSGAIGAIDPIIATVEGARHLFPGCRNLISLGGESFALILLDANGRYVAHEANSPCAAGTGSFIEQQAERLGLGVEELASRAASFSGGAPLIATRCAVFAKTDIVHAMQQGHGLDAVCAGICDGIARSVLDVLVKGTKLSAPVGLVGGMSLNARIASAIERILGVGVSSSRFAALAGAVGAAALADRRSIDPGLLSVQGASHKRVTRPILSPPTGRPKSPETIPTTVREGVEISHAHPLSADGVWVGVDVGSTSTKTAVLDQAGRLLGGFYTRTEGDPIAAVSRLLDAMKQALGEMSSAVRGVCTTGSGRRIIGTLFGADLVANEITAHARAAVDLHPGCDTIIEIGGQDSKFTRLRDGEVMSASMNYVCAAGTGSFIEEQAKRLGVGLEEFADLAMREPAPFTSDRCTVYMERDLNSLLAEGWSKASLAAAVLHSVRDNYLSKVVGRAPLGERIVFQGATARNKALVAAFESALGKPIEVSPSCHLTGAIGAALLCRDAKTRSLAGEGAAPSRFAWEFGAVRLERETCDRCPNRCPLTVAVRSGSRTGWGMKCGREYGERRPARPDEVSAPELRYHHAMRELLAEGSAADGEASVQASRATRGRILLPLALANLGYEPLWRAMLSRLGFSVEVTTLSRRCLETGGAVVNADFCAPIVVAHGHAAEALRGDGVAIFWPAFVNEKDPGSDGRLKIREKVTDAYFCYYSQYVPTVLDNIPGLDLQGRLISPLICLNGMSDEKVADAIHAEMARLFPEVTQEEVRQAFASALADFRAAERRWAEGFSNGAAGSEALRVALMGRPYVLLDSALNLGIPRLLERLGCEVWWQDEFALGDGALGDGALGEEGPGPAGMFLQRMNWHYGRRILMLAEKVARTENLYPVFLTCFRCSPDSFLVTYVKDLMERAGKPLLVLQLDAHSSDVGYETRVEAAVASFQNHRLKRRTSPALPARRARDDRLDHDDTVLVPSLDRFVSSLWPACFQRAGYEAVLLHPDASSTLEGYRHASGGECMPLVSIVGSAIEHVRRERLKPERCLLYLPAACIACNLPQFPVFADMAFCSAGIGGVKIPLLNTMTPGAILPQSIAIRILESNIAGSALLKLGCRIRPYEAHPGETDAMLERARQRVGTAIREGADPRDAFARSVQELRAVARDESRGRRPRVGVLGDLYAKYSDLVNQKLVSLIEGLGGEVVLPSMTELALHFYDADARLSGDDPRRVKLLQGMEQRYEKLAEDLLGDQGEPDFGECVKLMEGHGVRHYLVGETTVTMGRAFWWAAHRTVDAIAHVAPMFCCPGVVSSSILRKLQQEEGIPVVDIFYDGTGDRNRILVPHLHYLAERCAER